MAPYAAVRSEFLSPDRRPVIVITCPLLGKCIFRDDENDDNGESSENFKVCLAPGASRTT